MPAVTFQTNSTVDINIKTESDVKSVHIDNNIFLHNGNGFYQLKVNGSQKYLIKLAMLNTDTLNATLKLDVVLHDNNKLIVILAKYNYFEVFEISNRIISSKVKPIQKITTSEGFKGSKILTQANGEIVFITVTHMSSVESIIR